jgi:hypothetical protein
MTNIYPVSVSFVADRKSIFLRELTTQDELSIVDSSTIGAIQLINNLSEHQMNNIEYPFRAETLVSADRDSLLAAIYKKTYSDLLQSTIQCASCKVPFDLDFSLTALINYIQQSNSQDIAYKVKENGYYELSDGTYFRLPTGEDEFAIAGLPPQSSVAFLLEKCVQKGDINLVGQQVQSAMAQIASVLATEIGAICPECGHQQEVYFDIQSFLLSRLIQEKKQVLWEVHRIASVYHWTHNEIMILPRSLRKNYVSLIDSEL